MLDLQNINSFFTMLLCNLHVCELFTLKVVTFTECTGKHLKNNFNLKSKFELNSLLYLILNFYFILIYFNLHRIKARIIKELTEVILIKHTLVNRWKRE